MPKRRFETWLTLIVVGVGLFVAFIAGLWGFMAITANPIHPTIEGVSSSSSPTPLPEVAAAVARARQIMKAGVSQQNLPGASVAVGIGGDIVWAEGFGWADVEGRIPVTPTTQFRIGSASKALTSAAVGLLLEQGRLKLDDEIQIYVPTFPRKQWPITLRQLMAHLGGVRTDAGDEEPMREHCDRTVDGLRRFAGAPLLFEPGTQYRYSSYGWILVSAAVESAADESFNRFMRHQIFEPLGLEHTRTDAPMESAPDRSNDYFPRFAADPRYGPQSPEQIDNSCFSGAGAFLTTPSDLVRFVTALSSGKLLKPETVQMLQTSQTLPSGKATGYGLGWDLENVTLAGRETRWIGYDGDLRGGVVMSFATFPDHGNLIVVVTSNISFADTPALVLGVADAFVSPVKTPAGK